MLEEKEPYQPSEAEIAQAEEMMTPGQKKLSADREKMVNELNEAVDEEIRYKPPEEEINQAENMMTGKEKEMSYLREKAAILRNMEKSEFREREAEIAKKLVKLAPILVEKYNAHEKNRSEGKERRSGHGWDDLQ